MIKSMKELLSDGSSRTFMSAVRRCNIDKYNYIEKEFLFTGTANIYASGPDKLPVVKHADCEYTDRMVIRMPEDPADFRGGVIVEINNSTCNYDIERTWAEAYKYIMRHGLIYVGITSKPNVFEALRRFDSSRYGTLNWPNPSTEPDPVENMPAFLGPKDQELGYIWDILLDLPGFLKGKSESNPLKDYNTKSVYLTGWSQSCCYINRFIKSFAENDSFSDRVSYDGYLSGGGLHSAVTPLNRYEAFEPFDSLDARVDATRIPLIELNTESENSNVGGYKGYDARRMDSSAPDFQYRYMEITGACHDALLSSVMYTAAENDVTKALGDDNIYYRFLDYDAYLSGNYTLPAINDYPKYYAYHLALNNLRMWAEDGVPPVSIPRIRQTGKGVNIRDAFGNSIGGIRSPLVDLPVARYTGQYVEVLTDSSPVSGTKLIGRSDYFSAEMINELYKNRANYRKLVTENVRNLVAFGMILEEDADDMIEFAVDRAVKHGLKE